MMIGLFSCVLQDSGLSQALLKGNRANTLCSLQCELSKKGTFQDSPRGYCRLITNCLGCRSVGAEEHVRGIF